MPFHHLDLTEVEVLQIDRAAGLRINAFAEMLSEFAILGVQSDPSDIIVMIVLLQHNAFNVQKTLVQSVVEISLRDGLEVIVSEALLLESDKWQLLVGKTCRLSTADKFFDLQIHLLDNRSDLLFLHRESLIELLHLGIFGSLKFVEYYLCILTINS